MVALVLLGAMSLGWMVAFTAVLSLEKVWRHGPQLARAAGIALVALGIGVLTRRWPGSSHPTRWRWGCDDFDLAGTALEACNCDPICPCRRIDGVPAGAPHTASAGRPHVAIETGAIGDVDVRAFRSCSRSGYSDDEPGSPWTWALYLDDRADDASATALAEDLTGRARRDAARAVPVGLEGQHLLGVAPGGSSSTTRRGAAGCGVGGSVMLRVGAPYATKAR